MRVNLQYWNSDYVSLKQEGSVALGHVGLRVTPESLSEVQPLRSRDGSSWITADVRLDNREDLGEAFGFSSSELDCVSDADLVLVAYEKWGESCVDRLRGDFAFAIWDSRKRTVLLARDHVGVRPLFYFQSKDLLVFSSELRGVVSHPDVPRTVDTSWLANYISSIHLDDQRESTFYAGVRLLSRAHAFSVSEAGTALREYWRLDPEKKERFRDFSEFKEGFRERFDAAVKCRLRSSFPIASELSSGIDCTSILSTAQRLIGTGADISLFTHGVHSEHQLAGKEILDEYDLACRFATEMGFRKPLRIDGSAGSLLQLARSATEQKKSPQLDLWSMMSQPLFDAAQRESGARVLLSGAGGNNMVSDQASYAYLEFIRSGRIRLFWKELGLESKFKGWSRYGRIRRLSSYILKAGGIHLKLERNEDHSFEVLLPDVLGSYNIASRRKALAKVVRFKSLSEKLVFQTTGFYLDRGRFPECSTLAQSRGVEIRYPMTDVRLLEYCLAAPSEYKRRSGWGRYLLRGCMDELPDFIRWRDDNRAAGIPWPQSSIFRERDELCSAVLKASRNELVRGLIDTGAISRELQQLSVESPFIGQSKRMLANLGLFACLSLDAWRQQ